MKQKANRDVVIKIILGKRCGSKSPDLPGLLSSAAALRGPAQRWLVLLPPKTIMSHSKTPLFLWRHRPMWRRCTPTPPDDPKLSKDVPWRGDRTHLKHMDDKYLTDFLCSFTFSVLYFNRYSIFHQIIESFQWLQTEWMLFTFSLGRANKICVQFSWNPIIFCSSWLYFYLRTWLPRAHIGWSGRRWRGKVFGTHIIFWEITFLNLSWRSVSAPAMCNPQPPAVRILF